MSGLSISGKSPGDKSLAVLLTLLFPSRLLCWLVVLGAILMLVGGAASSLLGIEWAKLILGLGGTIVGLITIFLLPAQFVSLATYRPLNFAGMSRRWLFGCLLSVNTLISVSIYLALVAIEVSAPVQVLFLAIALMVSWLFLLSVFISSYVMGLHGLLYVFNWMFWGIAAWLGELDALPLIGLLLASWGIFSLWWFRWQPKKFLANNLFMPIKAAARINVQQQANTTFVSGRANTWVGSRLLGVPDSWSVKIKQMSWLVGLGVLLVPLYLATIKLSDGRVALGSLSGLFILSVCALGFAGAMFRNLGSVWLVFSGNREQLYSWVWRRYLHETLPVALFFLTLGVLCDLLMGNVDDASVWFVLVGASLLFQMLVFYGAAFIYFVASGDFAWVFACGFFIQITWFFLLCATGLLFPLPFSLSAISIHWSWAPQLLVLALLYLPVRNGFSKANLVRPI